VAVDPVPLAIGGGAVHTDDVFRVAANAFSRDSQGIVLPGQAKVTALGTPGGAVNVAAGGLVIRCAQLPGQSYIARIISTTQVSIAANSSGSTRRDLVYAEIIDPDFSPWQPSGTAGAPNTSVPNGPYFRLNVISGVAAGTTRLTQTGYGASGVELARIDIPTGTTAITTAMITDLRSLAQPRVGFAFDVQSGPSTAVTLPLTQTTFTDFPLQSLNVYVPRWATHAQVTARGGVSCNNAANMDMCVSFAGTLGPAYFFDYNGTATALGPETIPFTCYGEFLVTSIQDATVTLKTQARRTFTGVATGSILFDQFQQIEYDVRFSERAI
jgi:hypothetical protein